MRAGDDPQCAPPSNDLTDPVNQRDALPLPLPDAAESAYRPLLGEDDHFEPSDDQQLIDWLFVVISLLNAWWQGNDPSKIPQPTRATKAQRKAL